MKKASIALATFSAVTSLTAGGASAAILAGAQVTPMLERVLWFSAEDLRVNRFGLVSVEPASLGDPRMVQQSANGSSCCNGQCNTNNCR